MPFLRGDVYRLKTDAVGKPRPVVIVSCDEFNQGPDVLAVPFHSQQVAKRKDDSACAEFYRHEGGLTDDCVAMTGYLQSIKKTDLQPQRIGRFDAAQLARLMEPLRWVLNLD